MPILITLAGHPFGKMAFSFWFTALVALFQERLIDAVNGVITGTVVGRVYTKHGVLQSVVADVVSLSGEVVQEDAQLFDPLPVVITLDEA